MRYTLLILTLLTTISSNAQSGIISLNDPHIVAQEDKMVYKSWGNFLPNPRYILGIQTRYSYTMTWGWLAPRQNKNYRRGDDIRPLKLAGEQSRREATTLLHSNQTKLYKDDALIIGDNAEKEYYYNTSINYAVDPLFVLYYRKKLKPIREWNPASFIIHITERLSTDKMIQSLNLTATEKTAIISNAITSRAFTNYLDEMDILTEQYDMATSFPMGRGRRIISYHEMYIKQRAMYAGYINGMLSMARMRAHIERYDKKRNNGGGNQSPFPTNDSFDDLGNFISVAERYRIVM